MGHLDIWCEPDAERLHVLRIARQGDVAVDELQAACFGDDAVAGRLAEVAGVERQEAASFGADNRFASVVVETAAVELGDRLEAGRRQDGLPGSREGA